MGSNISRPRSYASTHHEAHRRDRYGPSKPDLSFQDTSDSGVTSGPSSPLDSVSQSEALPMRGNTSIASSMSTKASMRSSRSSSSSKPLLRTRSSGGASDPTFPSRALPRSEQRPGKVRNLGVFGLYHHNPSGLAGFYDWEAEEGAYIPFRQQKSHRYKWRQEMRKAQEEEQQELAAKIASVEEKKAARRRAYEEHLVARGNAPLSTRLSSDEFENKAKLKKFL